MAAVGPELTQGCSVVATSIKVVKDNTKNIELAVKALTEKSVYVGIPGDSAKDKRDAQDGKPPPKLKNHVIGYIQEFGAPESNIPARPFLVPGVRSVSDKIASIFRKAGKNAIEGNLTDVERGLEAAGLVAQIAVKKTITDIIPPPLKESTLAARRSRGRTGTTPLIDTEQLLNSISYVIRKK